MHRPALGPTFRRARCSFSCAKFRVLPEHADAWPEITGDLTGATRAEPGCLWFDWLRSLDDPAEYVLVEAFSDDAASAAQVPRSSGRSARRRT